MPDLRIALIMGGGVSLGSFSAGALARVLRLLEFVERGPAKIDVVTGASAGSMTLAIMLYHLFRGSRPDVLENALRTAWVDRIDFDGLCPDLDTHRPGSLFSDAVVRSIAGEVLDFGAWEGGSAHPYFAEGTLVSFALTNMNGMPVRAEGQLIRQASASGGAATGRHSVFADAVQTTFHDDAIRFALFRDAPSGPGRSAPGARVLRPWADEASRADWAIFREAAIASGAFPAAFPPVRLPRRRADYSLWPEELAGDGFVFDYVDGGVLRNEPLREAIQLAGERDEGQEVERVFFFIDPNISGTRELYSLAYNQPLRLKSAHDDAGEVTGLSLETPSYAGRLAGVVGRLIGVLASQAAFRDWLRAGRVNSQIEWRDELAGILDELVIPAGSGVAGRIDALLERIYTEKAMRGVAGGGQPDPERIRSKVAEDLRARADGGPVDGSTKIVLLLDLVSNLREKRKINLVAITPASTSDGKPLPIAGNFLSNFGGFFNRDYRAFDYAAGEYAASEVLTATIGGVRPLVRPGAPAADRPAAPDVDPSYRTLAPAAQRRLEELVAGHARRFAALVGIPSVLRGIVAGKARGKVRASLIAAHPAASAAFMVEVANCEGLTLRGREGSADGKAGSDAMARTVVASQRRAAGRGAADGEFELAGPHILAADAAPRIDIIQKRFLRPSRTKASIVLTGDPAEWFSRASRSGMPILRVSLNGADEIACGPEELEDEPPHLGKI